MTTPSPEAVELALELVNLFTRGVRAGNASCTLESLALDNHARICLALEIEDRWQAVVTDREQADWCDVADVARTIDRHLRSAAA